MKNSIYSYIAKSVLYIVSILIILPIIFAIVLSLKDGITQYADFFVWQPKYMKAFWYSIFISISVSFLCIFIAIPAAFVIAKTNIYINKILLFVYIIVMVLPFQLTMLPQYIMYKRFNLDGSLLTIILPGIINPLSVFILTQSIKKIPDEVLEAAFLETNSYIVIMLKIVIGQIRPMIACLFVIFFVEYWNIVEQPLILLDDVNKYPLSMLLDANNRVYAGVVINMIPPLLVFINFRDAIYKWIN